MAESRRERGFLGVFGRRDARRSQAPADLYAAPGLTASGSPVVVPTRAKQPSVAGPDAIRARSQGWQKAILRFAETVPEVAGAGSLVNNSIQRVEWTVVGGNAALRQRVQARIDAIDKGRLGELIWLSGEGFIAVPTDPGEQVPVEDVKAPYTLSVVEINSSATPPTVKGPNGEQEMMTDPFMRIWRPSKSNRWQASSPNQAAMDLIEAMYLHQLADTAVATSRLAGAGIIFWPTNAPDVPSTDDGQPAPGSRQAMLKAFNEAAWSSITQRDSREATIPFVVFYDPDGGGEYKPEMFRIERDDQADQYATRFETYRTRYATAVDLPIESITGMGGTNHWSAWQIDVDKWKTYFAPLVELMRVEIERRIVQAYSPSLRLEIDETALIAKPDQTPTIMQLAQLDVVTPESVQVALVSGSLADLVMREAPARSYNSNTVSDPPSDFKVGGDRGGGKFRDQP